MYTTRTSRRRARVPVVIIIASNMWRTIRCPVSGSVQWRVPGVSMCEWCVCSAWASEFPAVAVSRDKSLTIVTVARLALTRDCRLTRLDRGAGPSQTQSERIASSWRHLSACRCGSGQRGHHGAHHSFPTPAVYYLRTGSYLRVTQAHGVSHETATPPLASHGLLVRAVPRGVPTATPAHVPAPETSCASKETIELLGAQACARPPLMQLQQRAYEAKVSPRARPPHHEAGRECARR